MFTRKTLQILAMVWVPHPVSMNHTLRVYGWSAPHARETAPDCARRSQSVSKSTASTASSACDGRDVAVESVGMEWGPGGGLGDLRMLGRSGKAGRKAGRKVQGWSWFGCFRRCFRCVHCFRRCGCDRPGKSSKGGFSWCVCVCGR